MTSSVTVNTYTSSGYQAYRVGASDLDKSFPGWAIAVIVVVAVCVVAAVVAAVVLVKKRQGVSRSASGSIASKPVATTDGQVSSANYGSFKDDAEGGKATGGF